MNSITICADCDEEMQIKKEKWECPKCGLTLD